MNTLVLSDNLNTKLAALFATLASLGVAEVTFSFSGGGDEGNIDDTSLSPEGEYEIDERELESIAEAILEEYGYDWYNNEGGEGTITLVVASKNFTIAMYLYETVSHEYPAEGSING